MKIVRKWFGYRKENPVVDAGLHHSMTCCPRPVARQLHD